jgi:type IV pilus assembly protein PilC
MIFKKKITKQTIILFFEQLSQLTQNNISLIITLEIIQKNLTKNKLSKIIYYLISDIKNGQNLSESLSKYSKYFPEIITEQIKFSEKSGNLNNCLKQITLDLKSQDKMRKNILKAITYPTLMLTIAILLCAIFIIFVIPTFENLFNQFNAPLPYFTNLIIKTSNNISDNFKIYFLYILLIFIIIKKIYKSNNKTKYCCQIFITKIPIIGNLLQNYKCAKFSNLLALSLESNIPIDQALLFISNIFKNHLISKNIKFCIKQIKAGNNLSSSILISPNYKICFSEYLIQMIKLGENTGNLSNTLYKTSEYFQQNIESFSSKLNQLLEPILILISGIIIGTVIIAMYLPIFNMGMVM